MKILVVGGGSIGLLVSSYLQMEGHDVSVVTRLENQAKVINRDGLIMINKNRKYVVRVQAFHDISYKKNSYDVAAIALKQTHLNRFFDDHLPYLSESALLFLQNGMGHMEKAELQTDNRLFAGIVTHGALKLNDNKVKHTGNGGISVGSWKNSNDQLNEVTNGKLLGWKQSNNIHVNMKEKLLINLVVNPLTALYKVRNGALLDDPYIAQVKALFEEGKQLLKINDDYFPTILNVIRSTSKNKSSMYQDVQMKRKTEIESITGYLLIQAKKQHIHVPNIMFVHNAIKDLERSWGDV
ncbi:ketopantoate reductase family protein [Evansella halocellulosilytica]|uniref:ketopantoate reductase family protein n=1 Tax=Evansella halocellulosilytica TaxID=2011013 RepID=UPI000BB80E44|nr:2-dehydropantoate 2-reductase [Evansella halocellulosilytica]